jgi:hypothetical protein
MRPLREAHPQPPTGWPGREYQRPAVLAPCGVAGGPARWHPATGHGARHVEPARVTRESEPALRGRYEGERPGASAGPWRPPGHGIWASSREICATSYPRRMKLASTVPNSASGDRFHTWGVRGPPRGRGFIRGAYVDRQGAAVSYAGRTWTAKGPRFHTRGVRGPARGRGDQPRRRRAERAAGRASGGAGERRRVFGGLAKAPALGLRGGLRAVDIERGARLPSPNDMARFYWFTDPA